MTILKEQDFMTSNDLTLSASLICMGYTVEAINKENLSKVEFIFKRDNELDNYIKLFWKHELRIDPIQFASATKELKNRIYNN